MAFALNGLKILAWSHLPEVREKCFSKKVKGQKKLVYEEETNTNVIIEIRNTFHTVGIDSFTMYGYKTQPF